VRPLKLNVTFNFSPGSSPRGVVASGGSNVAKAEGARRDRPNPSECRCLCGSLVARRVPEGVELKCRRCKRTVVLPLDLGGSLARPPEAAP
jgi:hypothetical protein